MNVVEVLESFFDDDDDEIVFPGSDDESILEDINDDSDDDIEIVSLQLQNKTIVKISKNNVIYICEWA